MAVYIFNNELDQNKKIYKFNMKISVYTNTETYHSEYISH